MVCKARDGDLQAFRVLVDHYKDKGLSLAISILKDKTQAEDALQESFIKVYKSFPSFAFQSKFATWFYRIVVNTSYNVLRKEKRQIHLDEIEYTESTTKQDLPNDLLNQEIQKEYIQQALTMIKADEAISLRLFYLCECDLKEIESITAFSSSKIRVDLHRGRKNFKTALKKILGPEINNLL